MSFFSRNVDSDDRATHAVHIALLSYSPALQIAGISVADLLRDHKERLPDVDSILAAIDLLAEEGKIIRDTSGKGDLYERTRVFPYRR
jgi:hypothetical protein